MFQTTNQFCFHPLHHRCTVAAPREPRSSESPGAPAAASCGNPGPTSSADLSWRMLDPRSRPNDANSLYIHIYIYIYICLFHITCFKHIYIITHVYIYIYIYVVDIYTWVCSSGYTCIYTYIYIYTCSVVLVILYELIQNVEPDKSLELCYI